MCEIWSFEWECFYCGHNTSRAAPDWSWLVLTGHQGCLAGCSHLKVTRRLSANSNVNQPQWSCEIRELGRLYSLRIVDETPGHYIYYGGCNCWLSGEGAVGEQRWLEQLLVGRPGPQDWSVTVTVHTGPPATTTLSLSQPPTNSVPQTTVTTKTATISG